METQIFQDANNNKRKQVTDYEHVHGTDGLHFEVCDIKSGTKLFFISHWHSEYEIIYLLDHYLDYSVDGKIYHLMPGQALFINSNSIHGHAEQNGEYGHYVSFHFGKEFLFPDSGAHIYRQYFLPLENGKISFTKHIKGSLDYEKEILLQLKELTRLAQNAARNALSVQICLLRIYDIMFRENAFGANLEGNHKEQLIRQATAYINENYTSDILLSDIAKLLGIHADYMGRLFREYMGVPPKQYILNLRMKRAVREIHANPEESFSDIAAKAGFADANYFSRLFKQYMGMSPSEYKKQLLR